jgi:hypothetical protein
MARKSTEQCLRSRALAITHTTTVLDPEHGLGLAVMTVPASAMPGGESRRAVAEIGDAIGVAMRHRFLHPRREVLLAALAALLLDENATAVIRRADRLLRQSGQSGSDPLPVSNLALRELIEGCVDDDVVLAQEEGFTRRTSLCDLVLESDALWVASTNVGQRPVLAAMIGQGIFLLVVPVGHCARVLSIRVAEWLTPERGTV